MTPTLMPSKETTDKIQTKTDKPWLYKKGQSGNIRGRPKLTKEEKEIKKAKKELIKDYTDKLTEALSQISPVLIAKALAGELPAIKEINDRVLGKAKETLDARIGILNINQLLDDINAGEFPKIEE